MNDRIKLLGRQTMSDVLNGSDPYGDADRMYIPAEFIEKFAELIVIECMNATRGAITGLDAFNNIKDHFGFEK